jgi:TniQ
MPEAPLEADGLVRHPRPYSTESLFGYVLRLSEENGYRTPYVLLHLIGRERFRDPRFPLRELARIAHRELSELQAIAYSCIDEESRRRFRLLGHALPAFELKLKQPSLCPECVQFAGFIEAHWDLTLMTGCPVHRSHLLSRCPECHLQLRWLRPGQLECLCGATFGQAAGPLLSDSEVELLNLIRCKVLAVPVPTASSSGIPAAELSALSLRSLLSLIRTLARFHLNLDTVNDCDDPCRIVGAAAHVLSSYPVNFQKLLWTVGTQHGPKRSGGIVRSQFNSIYKGIFKRTPGDAPQSRDFLGSAFLDFAMNQWGRGVVDVKLLRSIQKTMPKRIVTFNEFRELYGLTRKEAIRVLAMKNIATTRICVGQRYRVVIDLRKLNEPPTVPGKLLSLPFAAATIGMSPKGLSRLRASGHFEVKYFLRSNGYHERDIKRFIERLLALNPSATNKSLPSDCITLSHAMCHHRGTGEGGASIIRALLSGELRVMGNVDGTVRGLFVSRAEFLQFGKNDRARQNGNVRTASEVAKELCCNNGYVPGLVWLRLLDARKTPRGWQISEQSIVRFKKKYVSLESIAREIGNSARDVKGYCAAKHIPMVLVKNAYHETRQAFVRIKDRGAVLSFRPVRMLNRPKAANQKRPNRAVSSPINRTAMEFTTRAA